MTVFKAHKLTLLLFSFFLAKNSDAQSWDWVRNAGNFNPNLNTWSYVTSHGVANDKNGNYYVMGTYQDTLRLVDTILVNRVNNTYTKNLFIIKYNASGQRLWVRNYINVEGYQAAGNNNSIALDSSGNIFITAYAYGSFLGQPINSKYFLCKMAPDGQLLWIKVTPWQINFTLDFNESLLCVFGNNPFTPIASLDTLSVSSINSVCLAKLSNNGSGLWIKQFPSSKPGGPLHIDISPNNNEILLSGRYQGTINFDGTVITENDSPLGGYIGRFSNSNGSKLRIVKIAPSYSTSFNVAAAKWLSDSTMVFGGSNGSTNYLYSLGDTSFDVGYMGGDPYLIFGMLDTMGKLKWLNTLKGGPHEFGYMSTFLSNVEIGDDLIYLAGSVLKYTAIQGDTIYRDYISGGFIGIYDFNGVYKGNKTGGIGSSVNNIKYIKKVGSNKFLIAGDQTHWSNLGFFTGKFDGIVLPPYGRDQMFMGVISGYKAACLGSNISFTSNLSGSNYQWQVNMGNGFVNIINGSTYSGVNTSTLQILNPPLSSNNYKYRCNVNGAFSAVFVLTVNPTPVITVTPSSPTVCSGTTLNINANGANNYVWTPSAVPLNWSSSSVSINPSTTTSYTVNGTKGGCTSSIVIPVSVNPSVIPSILINQTSCVSNTVSFNSNIVNGGNSASITWFKNGIVAGSGPTLSLTNLPNGTQVNASLGSSAPCALPSTATSNTLVVNCLSTSLSPISDLENFKIGPNPSSSFIDVSFSLTIPKKVSISVIDCNGKKVIDRNFGLVPGHFTTRMHCASLSGGVYLIKILVGDKVQWEKILIQR